MSSQNSAADKKTVIRSWHDLAKIIDHTNLRPEATANQIVRLCEEAREFGPVSYTHLDVYKRQVWTIAGTVRSRL